MKKRRFSLTLKIFLPTLLAVLLVEAGAYVGAVLTMNHTARTDAIATDEEVLRKVSDGLPSAGVETALEKVIQAYEANKPETLPEAGSKEESSYQMVFSNPELYPNPYLRYETLLEMASIGNYTDFLGIYYVDAAKNRAVAMCLSYLDGNGAPTTSTYIGYFFTITPFMTADGFYGERIVDPKYGNFFASGIPLTGDAQHQYWLIKETLESSVFSIWPVFSWQYAIVAGGALILLSVLLYVLIQRWLLRPIHRLSDASTRYASSLREGENKDEFTLSNGKSADELTDLNDSFYQAQESIKDYLQKVEEASRKEQRIQAELSLAERLQLSMVPSAPLNQGKVHVAGFMKPAKEVGGDLYGFFSIDDDHIGLYIGDVSGKGVPAALFMAKTTAVLRSATRNLDVEKANIALCENNTEEYFVTAFLATLELSTGKLRYVTCGHEPVMLFHDGKYEELAAEPNFMLGYVDDFKYVKQERILHPGDRLFLYTDGVSEAMNQAGELYGKKRIAEALNEIGPLPAEETMECFSNILSSFVLDAEPSDDACMVVLDYATEVRVPFGPGLKDFEKIAPAVDAFLKTEGMETQSKAQVLIDELCSNIAHYSENKNPACLCMVETPTTIEMAFVDDGVAFDPIGVNENGREDGPGGHGVMLAKTFADSMSYARVGGHNILRVTMSHDSK